MKLPMKSQMIHMVSDILLFVGDFIVGSLLLSVPIASPGGRVTYPVGAIPVGMVAATVFKPVVGDIARQGLGIVADK